MYAPSRWTNSWHSTAVSSQHPPRGGSIFLPIIYSVDRWVWEGGETAGESENSNQLSPTERVEEGTKLFIKIFFYLELSFIPY